MYYSISNIIQSDHLILKDPGADSWEEESGANKTYYEYNHSYL